MHAAHDLQERLAKQMRRAFFDQLELALEEHGNAKSVDWLIRLHAELGARFKAVLPSKHRDISDRFDNALFAQQLSSGAYGSEQLGPLIEYTWALLRMACAPDMDTAVQAAYNKVAASLVPGAAFSTVVPLYLKCAHEQVDEVVRRIGELNQRG